MAAKLSSKLTIEALNETNYASWAKSATLALSRRGKLGHITKSNPRPLAKSPTEPTAAELKKIDDWQMSDYQVMTLLLNSIESKIAKMFLFTKSAKDSGKN